MFIKCLKALGITFLIHIIIGIFLGIGLLLAHNFILTPTYHSMRFFWQFLYSVGLFLGSILIIIMYLSGFLGLLIGFFKELRLSIKLKS